MGAGKQAYIGKKLAGMNLAELGPVIIQKDTTGEAINELTRAMYKLLEEQKETNRLLRKELEPPSPWMTGDEAAEALGRPLTKSGEHLRCLKYFRDHGHLTVLGSSRPYTYSRAQVMELRKEIEREKVFIPDSYR